ASPDPGRACFVMLHYAPDASNLDLDTYLSRTPIHRALPAALALRGYDVHLVHLWPHDAHFVRDGVTYHFISEPTPLRNLARLTAAVRHGDEASYLPAVRAIRLIRALRPDVIHFHGCTLTLNLFLMTQLLRGLDPVITAHYHGGYPSRSRWVGALQRRGFARVNRFFFSTASHAMPFLDTGLIRDPTQVVELMETSSTFSPRDRESSRELTGMRGEPVILSVGRLHPVKDPLTMLHGFERVLGEWPRAELYLYYTSQEMLPEIQRYLDGRPSLCAHVHLRGRAEPEEMEAIYNSADFLLQASLREFSGCALLEAMACGVIPVVTDIPSFRAMTAHGRFGSLFPVGNADALAAKVLTYSADYACQYRREIRSHFERALSFEQMAECLDETYSALRQGQGQAVELVAS
ncbi:MAG: glycosyltransferase family 4 protein, partial [Nitrolancea sp.]